jgi:hypothetical protein
MDNDESNDGMWESQLCGGMIGEDVTDRFVTSDVETWR